MSKISVTPNTTGTGTFTVAIPNSNTDIVNAADIKSAAERNLESQE